MGTRDLAGNLIELLQKWGVEANSAAIIKTWLFIFAIIAIAVLANWLTKKIILSVVRTIIRRTKNEYDDIFLEKQVFTNLSHLVPALIIYFTIPLAIETPDYYKPIQSSMYIYMIIAVLVTINSFLNALHEAYTRIAEKKKIDLSIKGYIQVLKIIFIISGVILVAAVILNKQPGAIFAGLGALAAVLMLVFKDTILGFVASIQLSAYKMLKPGDWISMPSRGADGDVIDISLSTVKVQNFDKTISTIPTYALVSESFTNWTGMKESGGRRIKRSINIDMKSIRFCDRAMIEKFKKIHYLKDYIAQKEQEVKKYNEENQIDNSVLVNGRRMTNVGTFRKYVEQYLKSYMIEFDEEMIYNEETEEAKTVMKITKPGNYMPHMTMLVRQLQPSEKGLPIEIYVFTSTTEWAKYEGIQADLFDHILAVIPEFELRVFQNPSGYDLTRFLDNQTQKN